MSELEAIVWCPSCKIEKYEVLRVPAANLGVWHHIVKPEGADKARYCECGTVLERKDSSIMRFGPPPLPAIDSAPAAIIEPPEPAAALNKRKPAKRKEENGRSTRRKR